MPIINPTVETYRDLATRENTVFRDYFNQMTLQGDDGKEYFLVISVHRMGESDGAFFVLNRKPLWYFTTAKRKVIQKGEMPEINLRINKPLGTLKTELSDSALDLRFGEFHFTCTPPSFQLKYDGERASVDLELKSLGTPFWFNQGKEEGARISPSSLIHGIELFFEAAGTLVFEGRTIQVTGVGIHEHLIAERLAWLESIWQDWIWFVFDDLYGLIYEKQGGAYKEGCVYLRKEQEYLIVKELEIDHPKWAYSPVIQHDWPIRIEARGYTDKGMIHVLGDVIRSQPWVEVNKYQRTINTPGADMQVGWTGTFTYNDGRVLTLENGKGGDEIFAVYNFTN